MLNWRKQNEVIHTGKLLQYIPFDNVYVYFRYNDSKRVMVVINNNPNDQKLNMDRFSEGLANYKNGTDIITNNNLDLTEELFIPAKTSMIIELK